MTWIKICGMTTPEAVAAALDAAVDAVGFVFAQSVRQVTPAFATQLAAPARGRVQCIAVTRHPTQQAIDEIMAEFRPDVLQTDISDLGVLRLPLTLSVLPVLRHWQDAQVGLADRVLFEGLTSGSGLRSDWSAARAITGGSQLILAGGLNAVNVSAALSQVRPFGVDVSSGVESSPGRKSPGEIARFVAAVRGFDSERINDEENR
jgi:phosphoribosylanthranilate isomerase